MVELVERLLGKGYRLRLYDENVSLGRLMGTNKAFIDREIPHLAELMAESPEEVVQESRVLVISRQCDHYEAALRLRRDHTTLIRLEELLSGRNGPGIAIP
jgi:GDP-mannose 6-dehydrogenase